MPRKKVKKKLIKVKDVHGFLKRESPKNEHIELLEGTVGEGHLVIFHTESTSYLGFKNGSKIYTTHNQTIVPGKGLRWEKIKTFSRDTGKCAGLQRAQVFTRNGWKKLAHRHRVL